MPLQSILVSLSRRVALGVVVLWFTVTLTFAFLQIVPGDPAALLFGGDEIPTEEQLEEVRRDWGLERPVHEQYLLYIERLVHGDLGRSYQQRTEVATLLYSGVWSTVILAVAGLVLAVVISVPLATLTAGSSTLLRRFAFVFELVTISMPSFWIGIILILVFSFTLNWFPIVALDNPLSLVLPAATIALGLVGQLSQVMRESIERALKEPFILTARSRGLSDGSVRWGHALKHSYIPAATITGTFAGNVLTGVVVTETVFGRPGLGTITVAAITTHDIPLVLGVVIVSAAFFVLVNILVDLSYGLVDKRIGSSV
ncbi:ABC transporter permease [Pseudochelatococcus contaminans]|uniref:Peptide/nickel transport system permease protein n=1 Tax=Pseudochelatococcus contaminans TaxID=1538103 RepID=A0A7W5Z5I1_9HYPH|nr:ABC transporter permease [Pseudochelatococcus contaminans]MBB3810225.1 peptide/nickel transport system permease protein [Pseudochelatococcus contaminans]